MNQIKSIGVVGAGQMGAGIAQVAAQSGYFVMLSDVTESASIKAKEKLTVQLKKLIEKGKLSESETQGVLSRIQPVVGLAAFKDVDFVVEAAPENLSLKAEIFSKLDEICRSEVVLTSNTSSISITKIASQTKRPEQVAGMHFMNPVPVMKLVEGIRGIQTSEATFVLTRLIAEKMGKTFIEARDFPGFAVNRVLMPMINEAIYALYEGVASVEDLDQAMKLGTNQPMGPLTLADFIGLDTCLAIMNVLHTGLGDTKYRPCPLLKQYVDAGWLGKKSGRGFYRYDV